MRTIGFEPDASKCSRLNSLTYSRIRDMFQRRSTLNGSAFASKTVNAAQQSGLFAEEDFKRLTADGLTEVFMPRSANIHRDYNRRHYLLQCNMWFTLQDAGEDEVLRMFPQLYRQPILDMDATEENPHALGAPLRYRLAFGDAILFYGEHLRTSPPRGKSGRPFSYGLRIASQNADDARHYRGLFLDLRNFPTRPEPAAALGVYAPASVASSCALSALFELERARTPGEAELAHIADIFDHFIFVEDRYLMLAKRAAQAQLPTTAQHPLQTVAAQSPDAFWVAKADEAFVRLNDRPNAEATFRKSLRLLNTQPAPPNFMPVDYDNPPTQPTPDTIRRFCEEVLS